MAKKLQRLELPDHTDILDYSKYPRHPNICLVVIGKTGDGKSATANTILGRPRLFREGDTSNAVTTASEIGSTVWERQEITIVDTPGMQDPNMSPEEINREFKRIFELCPGGIHGFIHVKNMSNPRFTEDDEHVTSIIENTFGDKMARHTILVYTHVESKMHSEFCFQDFLNGQRSSGGREGRMAGYLDRLSWRIFAIDNYTSNFAEEEIHRRNLIAAANKMISLNKPNSIYAREAFTRALEENIRQHCDKFFPEDSVFVEKEIRANPQITDKDLEFKVVQNRIRQYEEQIRELMKTIKHKEWENEEKLESYRREIRLLNEKKNNGEENEEGEKSDKGNTSLWEYVVPGAFLVLSLVGRYFGL